MNDLEAFVRLAQALAPWSGQLVYAGTHYTLGAESKGFYLEFLTPLAGSGIKRNGQQDATMEKAGITAQKIRHLDILLVDPWVVKLHRENAPLKAHHWTSRSPTRLRSWSKNS